MFLSHVKRRREVESSDKESITKSSKERKSEKSGFKRQLRIHDWSNSSTPLIVLIATMSS